MPRIMSPTAVSVTEPPAADGRGSTAAARGVAAVARAADGRAEPAEPPAGELAGPPGELPKEQAETTSATAGLTIARSVLRRMRPNLARPGPACGDVEPGGGSGPARRHDMVASIDTEALRRKYAEERDKRLRPDGNDQYLRLTGELAHYLDDPYTPRVEREPLTDHVTVAFIGGGFAGLVTGARLREAGVDDIRIIEKGGDFGGTWYWNRYPGAQCDTAAMIYMPLL